MEGTRTSTLVGIPLVLVLVAGTLLSISSWGKQQKSLAITNFDECAAAGYPIMESYPERCRTADGRTFVNPNQVAPRAPATPVAGGCIVGGCSGQLCVSADEAGNMVTTCEYRAEYACYKQATCARQSNGTCGWTQTPGLQLCLANPPALDASFEVVY